LVCHKLLLVVTGLGNTYASKTFFRLIILGAEFPNVFGHGSASGNC
jgi:hypothetical protein